MNFHVNKCGKNYFQTIWIALKTDYRRINATHFKSDSRNTVIGSHIRYQMLDANCHRNEQFKLEAPKPWLQWSYCNDFIDRFLLPQRRSIDDYSRGFTWVFRTQPTVLSDLKGRLRNYDSSIKAGCICQQITINGLFVIMAIIVILVLLLFITFASMICSSPFELTRN